MNKETFDFVYECIKEIVMDNTAIPYNERARRLKIMESIKLAGEFCDFLNHIIQGTPQEIKTYLNTLSMQAIEKFIEDTYFSNISKPQQYEKVKKLLKMIASQKSAKTINQYISK
ncbi:MAG: hypothetical protein NC184_07635 [Roseburia sp.]|nr:hypothetical protein [Roseburia sp.]